MELVDDDHVDAPSVSVISTDAKLTGDESALSVCVGSTRIEVRAGFNATLFSDVLRVVLVVSKAEGVAIC